MGETIKDFLWKIGKVGYLLICAIFDLGLLAYFLSQNGPELSQTLSAQPFSETGLLSVIANKVISGGISLGALAVLTLMLSFVAVLQLIGLTVFPTDPTDYDA